MATVSGTELPGSRLLPRLRRARGVRVSTLARRVGMSESGLLYHVRRSGVRLAWDGTRYRIPPRAAAAIVRELDVAGLHERFFDELRREAMSYAEEHHGRCE